MSLNSKKILNIDASFVAAILMFCLAKPYFFWHGFLGSIWITFIFTSIVGFLFLRNKDKLMMRDIGVQLIWFIIILLYPILNKLNFKAFVIYIPLLFIPFSNRLFYYKVFDKFVSIYTFVLGISLVVYICALCGLISPYKFVQPLNSLKDGYYNVYPLLVSEGASFRFYGPFDEPGVVGTLSGLLICANGFNIKKLRTWILLLTGLCSLSFFFFVLVGFYLFIDLSINQKSFKNTILLIIGIIIIYIIINKSPVLYNIIGNRFVFDTETMSFAGDNRGSSIALSYLDMIKGTSQLWWGYNNKNEFLMAIEGSASFINVIVLNGLVFFILYLSFYILYGLTYKKTIIAFLLFLFAFMANTYQRPDLFNVAYVFLYCYLAKRDVHEQYLVYA